MPLLVTDQLLRAAQARVPALLEAVAAGTPRAAVFTGPDGAIDFILLAVPDYLVPVVREWLDAMNGGPPVASGHATIPALDPERN